MNFFKYLYYRYDILVDGCKWYIDGVSAFLSAINILLILNAWFMEKKAYELGVETANKIEYSPGVFPFSMVIFILIIPLSPFYVIAMRNLMNIFTFQLGREKFTESIMIFLGLFGHYQFIKMAIEFTPKL